MGAPAIRASMILELEPFKLYTSDIIRPHLKYARDQIRIARSIHEGVAYTNNTCELKNTKIKSTLFYD